MIDTSKQYTYQGKPVRIYADGSDTDNSTIHGAYKSETSGRWVLNIFNDSELVEAWEPKEGEVCYFWDNNSTSIFIDRFNCIINNKFADRESVRWDNCAPFTGELPEAFKGL